MDTHELQAQSMLVQANQLGVLVNLVGSGSMNIEVN